MRRASALRRVALALCACACSAASQAAQESPATVDLAALLPRDADLWIEVPELERCAAELGATRLARLLGRLSGELEPADLAAHLALPSDLPDEWLEDPPADVRELVEGLAGELGLSQAQREDLVGSLSGSLSIALLSVQEPERPIPAGLLVAAGLVAGGSTTLVDTVVAALEEAGSHSPGPELVELGRAGAESLAVWRWTRSDASVPGWLVVRPGCVAWCFEREVALALLHAEPRPASAAAAELELRRAASSGQGELLFVRLSGARLRQIAALPKARDLLLSLGLDGLAGFELGLRVDDGELRSRLRFDKPADQRRAPPSGARPPAQSWASLEVLPSDCLAVVGLRASPWTLGQGLARVAAAWAPARAPDLVSRLSSTPFFAALGERGVLRPETLLFARASGPGAPLVYLATPATGALDAAFLQLAQRGEEEVRLGTDVRLLRKRLGSVDAWVVFDDRGARPRSLFALAPCAGTWVLSDVSAQLQNLVHQREREHLAAREQERARLRGEIFRELTASGHYPDQLAAFVHVQSARIAEWAWPYAVLALQFSGAVEDPEELPDALEVAEYMGDTTTLMFDLDDAFEVRGKGLLGGLTLLF